MSASACSVGSPPVRLSARRREQVITFFSPVEDQASSWSF